MKARCKECNKRTVWMYQLNDGVYCTRHWAVAYSRQEMNLKIESMRERASIQFFSTSQLATDSKALVSQKHKRVWISKTRFAWLNTILDWILLLKARSRFWKNLE